MAKETTSSNASKYNERRWSIPSKRAKGYAEDRKAKVHTYGKRKVRNSQTSRQVSVRDIFNVRGIMPDFTSTKSLGRRQKQSGSACYIA